MPSRSIDHATRGASRERGSITAEFAVVLPAVAVVLVAGLVGVQAVGMQVRATDAAASAARLLARGENSARVAAVVGAALPHAGYSAESSGELICVRVDTVIGGGSLLSAITVGARSCALAGGL